MKHTQQHLDNAPVIPTGRLPTTSAIVDDFINFQKACDMMQWIGDEMYKFLLQSHHMTIWRQVM